MISEVTFDSGKCDAQKFYANNVPEAPFLFDFKKIKWREIKYFEPL